MDDVVKFTFTQGMTFLTGLISGSPWGWLVGLIGFLGVGGLSILFINWFKNLQDRVSHEQSERNRDQSDRDVVGENEKVSKDSESAEEAIRKKAEELRKKNNANSST